MKNYLKINQKTREEKIELYIPPGPRLGNNNVIESVNVSKSFDDKILYENLEFKLPAAGSVGKRYWT